MKNYIGYSFLLIAFFTMNSCSKENETSILPETKGNTPNNIEITFKGSRDIFPTRANFIGNITQTYNENFTVGFVYSKTPNPTVSTGTVVTDYKGGSTDFTNNSLILEFNSVYYIKAFVEKANGIYVYSTESTFKTTGYYGPAGGYVAYDKGETTNGWRYMEIHPTTINYSSSGVGGAWGTVNNFISGTYPNFGKGKENTIIIINNEIATNCAAKLCDNLVRNGFSDWYLPSIDELITMNQELKKANISISNEAWSSSQYAGISAYNIYTTLANPSTAVVGTVTKGFVDNILPARRY